MLDKTMQAGSASSCSEFFIIESMTSMISNSFTLIRTGTISSSADKLIRASAASVLTDFWSSSKSLHKHCKMAGSAAINFLLSEVPVSPKFHKNT